MRKILQIQFWTLGNAPTRKCMTVNVHFFPVGALCEVQNVILKHFSHKVLYNYHSFKTIKRFGLYLTKSKNGFPIEISNFAR